MFNYYYSKSVLEFVSSSQNEILGEIVKNGRLEFTAEQQLAWETQIDLLQTILPGTSGHIFFEFSIPRMGKRVDCILIVKNVVFVIEFKVGEKVYVEVATLFIAGDHVPEIQFVELVGSGDIVAPEQNGPTCVNKGTEFGVIVMLIV